MSDEIASGATFQLPIADAASRIDDRASVRSVALFRHGTLLVKYYAPRGTDQQTPHTRDHRHERMNIVAAVDRARSEIIV